MERLAVLIMRFGYFLMPHREKAFVVVRRNRSDNARRVFYSNNLSSEVAAYATEAFTETSTTETTK